MSSHLGLSVLVVTLLGAGAFALKSPEAPPAREPEQFKTGEVDLDHGSLATALPPTTALPPGHPPIDRASPSSGAPVPASAEIATITWKVPAGWATASNPSSMRIATYRVPHAPGDTEDAEMSVVRAGGTTEANIQRWLGQFDDAGKDERTEKTVRGIHVAIVGVGGTFLGSGMSPLSAPAARPGWALLGAVVETPGSPYFFKLTGPAATVRAARASFEALITSIATK